MLCPIQLNQEAIDGIGGLFHHPRFGFGRIRATFNTALKRSPEVMVKISGGGRGMIQIQNHLDYISRNGQIELEMQDGEVVNGRSELKMLRDEWKCGGFQVADALRDHGVEAAATSRRARLKAERGEKSLFKRLSGEVRGYIPLESDLPATSA